MNDDIWSSVTPVGRSVVGVQMTRDFVGLFKKLFCIHMIKSTLFTQSVSEYMVPKLLNMPSTNTESVFTVARYDWYNAWSR